MTNDQVQMTHPEAALLSVSSASAGYGEKVVLRGVSVSVRAGERVALLGPNGAGKTTLLRLLGGLVPPADGTILLKGRTMADWRDGERAKFLAGVPQAIGAPVALRVRDVAATGRLPHAGGWGALGAADEAAIRSALEAVAMTDKADRFVNELSAGEKQRAWLAMALAQQPEGLLLDEPTAHLDIHQAWHLLELLTARAMDARLAVVFSTHDLNLAAAFASRVVLMKDGEIVADGAPAEVYSEKLLSEVYGHPLDVQFSAEGMRVSPRRRTSH